MKKRWIIGLTAIFLISGLTGCQKNKENTEWKTDADEVLVVYCPHPLEFINPLVSEFEERTGIRVQVQTGGTGQLLQMAEDGAEPKCDILWGGSLSTSLPKKDLFEPYTSVNEDMIQDEFKNEEGNMTRFTDLPSVLMINTNLTGDLSVEGYEDLLKPELKGKIAMCDPATSSSAYEHLINMIYAMGKGEPEQGWDYTEAFCRNLDGILLKGSSDVYQGVAEGRFAVGLTFEEAASHYVADWPVKLVYMKEGVVSKPDVVCIMKGTEHKEAAEAFVDFVTGKDAQTMIATTLDRRSVRTDVSQPVYLPDKKEIHIIYDDKNVVRDNKSQWLSHFSRIFNEVSNDAAE
ncbi:ABC transporter substrate-binding protein [Clostridium sp. chh4-2]|uniref:extracellular solute-binding protein n=1 Tax=Clostridium sp. chh4-2 TaxID=2067550 RepID=UPI000CCEF8F4|nr:extracellular solute-binding protein [Clostridium sp. chh4-2]PNV59305.1 ABC transporter substrate-binding protein [Clostridium sp. chh4-2]